MGPRHIVLKHPSIADIPESSLVEQLMANPYWRFSLLRVHGIPDGSIPYRNRLLGKLTGRSQGDVDILLSAPGQPELATAVEVKRIKVGAAALRNQTPNKLKGFKEGVDQANELARIGFSLVYLYVFVVVDSREKNAGRVSYEGLSMELKSLVERVISPSSLDKRVGLMRQDFVQSMDEAPLGAGSYDSYLVRLAESSKQPPEVTAWVAQATAAGED